MNELEIYREQTDKTLSRIENSLLEFIKNSTQELKEIKEQTTKTNGRVNMLEYRENTCSINEVKEICKRIPEILNEMKIMRIEQANLMEKYVTTNNAIIEINKQTEVMRFFAKYPNITRFILGVISTLAAMGGLSTLLKYL